MFENGETKLRRKLLIAALCAATMVSAGANIALAGEVTGNGQKSDFAQGQSICKFSGQNDNPSEAFPADGRVQSFGQLVKKLGPLGGVPGTACNPTKSSGGARLKLQCGPN